MQKFCQENKVWNTHPLYTMTASVIHKQKRERSTNFTFWWDMLTPLFHHHFSWNLFLPVFIPILFLRSSFLIKITEFFLFVFKQFFHHFSVSQITYLEFDTWALNRKLLSLFTYLVDYTPALSGFCRFFCCCSNFAVGLLTGLGLGQGVT